MYLERFDVRKLHIYAVYAWNEMISALMVVFKLFLIIDKCFQSQKIILFIDFISDRKEGGFFCNQPYIFWTISLLILNFFDSDI